MKSSLSTTEKLEEHAFFILFIAFIAMVFWHATWELLTELTDHLNRIYGIKKRDVYIISLVIVILFIGIFPQILQKI